jgi:glycosyltransferase involved in cell wall biosynthesis
VLLVPDGWPANFFDEQMDAVSDAYEFKVLLGFRNLLGKKKLIKRLFSRKFNFFTIDINDIYTVNYKYINKLPAFIDKIQWNFLMRKFDKCIHSIYEGGKPDIIHIHQLCDTDVFICEWALRNHIPIVMSEHLLYVRHQINNFERLKEKVFSQVDKVLCASNYQYRTLLTNGIKFKKVEIIGNLIVDTFIPETFKPQYGSRNIVFVASHLADKDIDILLDAIELLKSKHFEVYLDIIGIEPDKNYQIENNYQYNLQAVLESRNLLDVIHLKGRKNRQELLESYQNYSFLVSSSLSETFGVGVAEAIAYGLPVVCTDSGGIREFVDISNGIIVPIRNSQKLAVAIEEMFEKRLMYNPTEISERIVKKYGVHAFRKKLLRVYDECLNDL